MTTSGNIIKIEGQIKHEAWGGTTFIPELLKLQNTINRPFSEIAFDAQSHLETTDKATLESLIQQHAGLHLGKHSLQLFGPKLPFMFKMIDVETPRSLHVHPNKQQAENGFAREQACGMSNQSSSRIYKDTNHKPEFMVALTDFWQLHGLRSLNGIQKTFAQEASLDKLIDPIRHGSIRLLIETMLNLDDTQLDSVLTPIIEKYMASYRNKSLAPTSHHYWVMHCAAQSLLCGEPVNPGILMIYIMNLVHIPPGGSVYMSPSVMHAYLQGRAIEVTANSENILRIGLTTKRIDHDEFFKVASLNPYPAEILYGEPMSDGRLVYQAPIQDFKLNQYHWQAETNYTISPHCGPRLWFVYEGQLTARSHPEQIVLPHGRAIFQKPNTPLTIQTTSDCRVFMAEVGISSLSL